MSILPRSLKGSNSNLGQVLLLVLLSMAVILTLGLSVLSRSVTNTAVSTKEEEALRAFSAAEAGVEKALVTKSASSGTIGTDSQFNVNVGSYGSGVTDYLFPTQITSGESLTLWLVAHQDDGSIVCDSSNSCFIGNRIKVCWGKKGETPDNDAQTPALEMTVAYTEAAGYSDVKIARDTMDPYSSRTPANHFGNASSANCNIGGTEFAFEKTITLSPLGVFQRTSLSNTAGPQFARFRIFYNTAVASPIGVMMDSALPAQGLQIESTGVSGESNRRLEVFQGYGEPPSIFDAAIFSVGGISQ